MALLHLHHPALQGLLALAGREEALVIRLNREAQEIHHQLLHHKATTVEMQAQLDQITALAAVVVHRLLAVQALMRLVEAAEMEQLQALADRQ
jgi:hydrogenase-4 membrane subunit HyfE